MLLKVFNDMVPGIGVECMCPSGAMLAKTGTVLDVCLVGGDRLRSRGMCEFLVLFFFFLDFTHHQC